MRHTESTRSSSPTHRVRDTLGSVATLSILYVIGGLVGIVLTNWLSGSGVHGAMRFSPAIFAHAVNICVAWVAGWRSIVRIAPGCAGLLLLMNWMDHPYLQVQATSLLLMVVIAPLSFTVMQWAGLESGPDGDVRPSSWKAMILGSGKASVTTYLATAAVVESMGWGDLDGTAVLLKTVVDILSLVALITATMFVFRWRRLASRG